LASYIWLNQKVLVYGLECRRSANADVRHYRMTAADWPMTGFQPKESAENLFTRV